MGALGRYKTATKKKHERNIREEEIGAVNVSLGDINLAVNVTCEGKMLYCVKYQFKILPIEYR